MSDQGQPASDGTAITACGNDQRDSVDPRPEPDVRALQPDGQPGGRDADWLRQSPATRGDEFQQRAPPSTDVPSRGFPPATRDREKLEIRLFASHAQPVESAG